MALIKCKGCGQMVSTKAEKCPKCGYSVRLSMEQQEETKQSVKPHTTTLNTSKEEVVNDNPQPQQRSSKKSIIIAVIVIVIIGCGVLFAVLNNNRNSSSIGQSQDTTAIVNTEIKQDELPSGSLVVATENDNFVVSDSCATEALENITLYGSMTDANGTYPIELAFVKDGDNLSECIYTNVDLGGKIKMDGEIVVNEYVFTGKDGMNKFQIHIDGQNYDGFAIDGSKELSVSLDKRN